MYNICIYIHVVLYNLASYIFCFITLLHIMTQATELWSNEVEAYWNLWNILLIQLRDTCPHERLISQFCVLFFPIQVILLHRSPISDTKNLDNHKTKRCLFHLPWLWHLHSQTSHHPLWPDTSASLIFEGVFLSIRGAFFKIKPIWQGYSSN